MVDEKLEIKGEWKVDTEKRSYVWKDYKVDFIQLNQTAEGYTDLQRFDVYKEETLVRRYVLRQIAQNTGNQTKLYYDIVSWEPEGGLFNMRSYDAYPDLEVLAVQCLTYTNDYEKNVLHGLDWKKAYEIRKNIINEIKAIFPKAGYFYFVELRDKSFLFRFEPAPTRNFHWIGAVYNIESHTFNVLNNLKSLQNFLNHGRYHIKKDTVKAIMKFVSLTALFQDKFVIDSSHGILDLKFVDDTNREEITKIAHNFTDVVKPAYYERVGKKDTLVFYTIGRWFPSELEEWRIIEDKDEYKIESKSLLEKVYYPSFLLDDFQDINRKADVI